MNMTLPPWTHSIGWTLVNSLWQGLAIMLVLITALRLMPSRWSTARYAVSCFALLMFLAAGVFTFVTLLTSDLTGVRDITGLITFNADPVNRHVAVADTPSEHFISQLTSAIGSNMYWIVLIWSVGTIVFSLKLFSGWIYLRRLKRESIALDGSWQTKLGTLCNEMAIRGQVTIAESISVTAPLVIGFVKPVILLPIGMIAGLTTQQIETIIVHELAHIKRHDFLINVLQACVETLFFFNPFVWVISNIIRREREFCCDDEVVQNGNSLAYAQALAQLEEWRLAKPQLAVALAENKNQLLNRIRRIMEKSGQKYSAKDKLVPAVLLVVGLMCASWLTIQSDARNRKERKAENEQLTTIAAVAADTTIKKKQKSSSKVTVITFDEDGEAHENIYEEFDGDFVPPSFSYGFEPAIAAIDVVPAIPGFPAMEAMGDMVPPFFFSENDSIPGVFYRSNEDWDEFSKAFEQRFKEQFGDFYKKNQKDFDEMMKEMRENFVTQFKEDRWQQVYEARNASEDQFRALSEIQRMHELTKDQLTEIEYERKAVEEAMADVHRLAPVASDLEEAIIARSADVASLGRSARLMEEQAKELELQTKQYEKELKELLVKDGYLAKDEKLKTMEISDEEMKVNGKKIKDSDLKKYTELKNKYSRSSYYYMKTE